MATTENAGATTVEPSRLRYADVGINLSDSQYRGVYHGKKHHEPDLDAVIERGVAAGCVKFMVTGSDLKESEAAVDIAKHYPGRCFATVGVHPCSAKSFANHPDGAEGLLSGLRTLAMSAREQGQCVAFGEIGLDYDRLQHASVETQVAAFEQQLELAAELGLPLFLHMRAAFDDFERLLVPRLPRLPRGGLVHSFTGTFDEMRRFVDLGLDIGVNGCSLKTSENVEVVKQIPLGRLQIETDGPWCEMRGTHASAEYKSEAPELPKAVKKEKWQKDCMVKGRNEPCTISHVAYAVAKIKGISVEEVTEAAWTNSIRMFGLGEKSES